MLRLDRLSIGLLCIIVPLLFFVLPTVGSLLLSSLTTGTEGQLSTDAYSGVFSDPDLGIIIYNTLAYAFLASIFSIALGTFFAILTERTNVPLRRFFPILIIIPLAIPWFLLPFSWIFLLDPRICLINVWIQSLFGMSEGPFTIYGLPGMIWVTGIGFHFSYLLLSSSFANMDATFEEAARIAGSKVRNVFSKITMRLMLPAIFSVFLIEFVRVMEFLDTPLLLGIPKATFVLSTRIWFMTNTAGSADPSGASVLGMFFIGIAVLGVWAIRKAAGKTEKYATITGKGSRATLIDLGRWKYVLCIGSLLLLGLINFLPLFILAWVSLLPFYQIPDLAIVGQLSLLNFREVFSSGAIVSSIYNTMILVAVVPSVVMLFTAVVTWFSIRTKIRGIWLLDTLAFLPIAIPGIVLGLSMIWIFGRYIDIGIFGTIWIILVAYFIKYMPYGVRWNAGTMVQISNELEEVGRLSGAGWLTTFRRITLPLLKTGMITGWLFIALSSMKELSVAIMLAGPRNRVFSSTLWELWEDGSNGVVGAYGVIMLIPLAVMVVLYVKLGGLARSQS